jgi:putative Holliday junction resolvase
VSSGRALGKVLGLDVGLARIGVAVGDGLGLTARPVTVIRRRSREADFAQLAMLIDQEQAVAVVCGLPLNMDGSEGEQSAATRKWALRLAQALRAIAGRPVPVIFWDERLSTYAANEILAQGGTKQGEDAVAAAVMLQSYLDAQRRGEMADYGRIDLPPKVK